MIYMFNVSKDDGFCIIVADSVTIYNVKILELIEYDDINLWYQNIIKIHQKYNIRHQYYLGSDDFFNVLKLASPEYKRLIYRKEFDDLTLDKLIKKLSNNTIELSLECEYLKTEIFSNDIKIDSLKLIASINCFWIDERVKDNGIIRDYNHKKQVIVKRWEYSDITLQDVLRHFD